MNFDLDARTASLSVGEFSDFSLGPRDSPGAGAAGLWRAQLGTHWHNEFRLRATAEHAASAEFEIPIAGQLVHRGWTLTLTGRIDQLIRTASSDTITLREIKSVTQPLPAGDTELRRDYPGYFVQLATYAALARLNPRAIASGIATSGGTIRAELVFVETGSGLAQTITLDPGDDTLFRAQLERVAEFLDLRLRARQRLHGLRFRPAFTTPRPGQETTRAELTALFERHPLVLFEAPTGFGKTGVLLEFALGQLQSGHFDRALYLTSKSTGQLQVVRTLATMNVNPADTRPNATTGGVAVWHVRNKSEHCVNPVFHCTRETCAYLADAAARWPASGLARFYLDEQHPRDLETLRSAGRDARICPYEVTRAALAFNDVWIGDYNYVFAPRNRTLFHDQPGFVSARTLLVVDEAHNLPSRVADAWSHRFTAAEAFAARDEMHRVRPSAQLMTAWDRWCHFLQDLPARDALPLNDEDEARHLLDEIARHLAVGSVDFAALGPAATDTLWRAPALLDELASSDLPRLWWSPRASELELNCLDAARAIGSTLREFGGVVLASATLTPVDGFAVACGLDAPAIEPPPTPLGSTATPPERLGALTKRDTRKLYRQLTTAADLLRVEEARAAAAPDLLRAHAPWREGTYAVAVDTRVDTTFQHRSHHYTTTAATVAAVQRAAQRSSSALPGQTSRACVAVFFPSYAYADAIVHELAQVAPALRVAMQPRLRDLTSQAAWVGQSLVSADALFLVLGSSFAESIDVLGGRVSHALVVGPALPEVNAVQRARLAEAVRAGVSREAAFRRVYQIPGMTKVNQALGRLVRAPGQSARVLLHCRRFVDPSYAELLAREYRPSRHIATDADLDAWLQS
jgi:Rad3-related DNA helicase